jgi:hypothetical protein
MNKITLISNTKIISKIFQLVCIKLNINYNILSNDDNVVSTDILILEDTIFDKEHMMRYKSLCSRLVIISKENAYEYDSSYIIKKPFLPSTFEKELLFLNSQEQKKIQNETNELSNLSLDEGTDDLVDFINTIDDEVLDENNIEINVNKSTLASGGVLDSEELNILNKMINDTGSEIIEENDSNDLSELSDIIDKTIDDIQEYNLEDNELTLILNNYELEELAPLLNKLNQSSIDKLTIGEELNIKLKVINE